MITWKNCLLFTTNLWFIWAVPTSWQKDGERVKTVTDFILLGSKITADGDCSHEIKRCLPLGRKVTTNIDSTLKSRDITLPTKIHLVKAVVFWVVFYGYHWRIDDWELWCWRILLRFLWTARRSSQSIIKDSSPGCSLEGLMLKLKLQYFGHLMQRADSFEKTWCQERLRAGGEGNGRGWDDWMTLLTQWIWVWVDSRSWWWTGRPGLLPSMDSQRVRHNWVTELTEHFIRTITYTESYGKTWNIWFPIS